jgi:hypothetical protein
MEVWLRGVRGGGGGELDGRRHNGGVWGRGVGDEFCWVGEESGRLERGVGRWEMGDG